MRREDTRTGPRADYAIRLFFLTLALVAGSLIWIAFSTGPKGAGEVPALFFVISLLVVLVSGVYAVSSFGRLWWWYKCPQCHRPAKRVQDKNLRLRYHCGKCRVEWDTGWDDVPEGD